MNWIELDSIEKIDIITEKSKNERVLIFKFQPRRIVDILIRGLLERDWYSGEMGMDIYFLDVTEHPGTTQKVNSLFNVSGETPQVLIIENEKCIFSLIAGNIYYNKIRPYSNVLSKVNQDA